MLRPAITFSYLPSSATVINPSLIRRSHLTRAISPQWGESGRPAPLPEVISEGACQKPLNHLPRFSYPICGFIHTRLEYAQKKITETFRGEELGAAKKSYDSVTQEILSNAHWKENRMSEVKDWLSDLMSEWMRFKDNFYPFHNQTLLNSTADTIQTNSSGLDANATQYDYYDYY
ncbi:hypothetical protein ElyMa_002276200 [Elysia marginata]|uniref:Angiotensin-converting enzyme n=1 Tax=Elysia marginata TaxID=1093978 RepID=A0AAV4G2I5_9GAST|nr:hypothetical protein ElyMa_002276200 [Elysia marginata]